MAVHTRTFTVDDIDGSDGATAQTFSLNGIEYTIDLSQTNAKKLESALAPFIERATRVGGRRKGHPRPRTDLAAIREWAHGQGIEVSDRGRVAASIVASYDEATG